MVLFKCVLMCLLCCLLGKAQAKFVSFEDPDFKDVHEDLLEWFRENSPNPVKMKCTLKDHKAALTQLMEKSEEEAKLQTLLHNSMLSANDKSFFGLNETIAGIRSTNVALVLIEIDNYISVADYRKPLTGNHLYQIYNEAVPRLDKELSDGTAYGTYVLHGCLPLPTYIRKTYGRRSPRLLPIHNQTSFFKAIGSIGGFFEDRTLLSSIPPTRTGKMGRRNKYLMIYKKTISDY